MSCPGMKTEVFQWLIREGQSYGFENEVQRLRAKRALFLTTPLLNLAQWGTTN